MAVARAYASGSFRPVSHTDRSCASSKRQIDLNRLDREANQHGVNGVCAGGSGVPERSNQHLGVVDRGDEATRRRFKRQRGQRPEVGVGRADDAVLAARTLG